MRSKNFLKISGTVVSVSDPLPGKSFTRFTLVHHFGGPLSKPPLFLSCIYPEANAVEINDHVVVDAYLVSGGKCASANVNRITIIND